MAPYSFLRSPSRSFLAPITARSTIFMLLRGTHVPTPTYQSCVRWKSMGVSSSELGLRPENLQFSGLQD